MEEVWFWYKGAQELRTGIVVKVKSITLGGRNHDLNLMFVHVLLGDRRFQFKCWRIEPLYQKLKDGGLMTIVAAPKWFNRKEGWQKFTVSFQPIPDS